MSHRHSRAMALMLLALAAAAPPRITTDLPGGQAPPVARPYDETADAHRDVAAATAEAARSGRGLLLDFGGNWCPDCRMLAGVLALPAARRWTDGHFVTVMIDVARETKNLDLAARYGVRITAVPTVLVVGPDGRLLNSNDVFGLANARSWSAQAVMDLLARWTPEG